MPTRLAGVVLLMLGLFVLLSGLSLLVLQSDSYQGGMSDSAPVVGYEPESASEEQLWSPTPVVNEMLVRLNEVRRQNKMPAVKLDPRLCLCAQRYADVFAADPSLVDKFAPYHHRADGSRPETRMRAVGYYPRAYEEAIGVRFATVDQCYQGWMGGHNRHAVLADHQDCGLGYAVDRSGRPLVYVLILASDYK